ncbi:MAG: alkaline phosphatase family protein [Candidatus Eisenbacteria bacterium]
MRPKDRRLLAVLLTLCGVLLSIAPAQAAILTRHVVIVVIDGARYSETFGDPTLGQVPRIGQDLAAIGAEAGTFRNVGVTNTVPGMSAIMTGTLQPIANDGSERPHLPTLCEYLRKDAGVPDSLVRIVALKQKLHVLAASDHPAYGLAWAGHAHVGDFAGDLDVFLAARAELLQYRPKFMLFHMGMTDIYGHQNDWPNYLASIHLADSLVWQLWTDLQADPEFAGHTTLFVTNDHGRHDNSHGGFVNHGDGCAGCQRIMMIVAGPDTKTSYVSGPAHWDQRDITSTAAHLLGVAMPYAQGQVMDDLLLEPTRPLDVPGGGGARLTPALGVYPNPTRGGAVVRLARGAAPGARVEILDTSGRVVARLVPEYALDGAGSCTWSGLRVDGRRAAPGVYQVRVQGVPGAAAARLVKLQ